MSKYDNHTLKRVATAAAARDQICWSDAQDYEIDWADDGTPIHAQESEAHIDRWRLQARRGPPTSSEKYKCWWSVDWYGTGDPPALSRISGRTKTLKGAQKMAEAAFGMLSEMKGFLQRDKVEDP